MKLSIVTPCYNEEKNVKLFYEEIVKNFEKEKYDVEVIFVDDGSKDNTKAEIDKIVSLSKKIIIKEVSFSRNFGKEAAMYAGLKKSSGDYVCIIDADLQQDPAYIKKMLAFLDKNPDYDEVAAYQGKRKEGFVLSFFKKSFYRIINKITTIEFVNGASDFRLFKRKVVDSILEISEYHRFSKGIFSFVGYKIYFMPYEVKERQNGTSSWSFTKLFKYALEGITAYTTLPLRLPYIFSLLFFIGFLAYLIVLICLKKFMLGTIIILIILFSMSLLLFILGIFGGYISKMYIQGKNRPVYIIRDYKCNKEDE